MVRDPSKFGSRELHYCFDARTSTSENGMKRTMRASRSFCSVLALFSCCALTHAAGFQVELKLGDGKTTQSQKSKPASPPEKAIHRITLESSVDVPFSATWKVTRTNQVEAQDALVHFVVVKLDRPGQALPPLEPDRVPVECALTMDFAKDRTATGKQPFHVDSPGVYLVRIEAGGDPDKPGQEDFAEIELVVK